MNSINALIEDFYKQKNSITDCQLQPYNIKLVRPWKTASSQLSYRQGLLLKLTINHSQTAIGECAPMQEIGTETLAQAQDFLVHRMAEFIDQPFDKALFSGLELLPTCRFALESVLLSFLTIQQNKSISQLLNPGATQSIQTNFMLGTLDDKTLVHIKNAEQEGFNCIKLKLGLNDIKTDIYKLQQLFKKIDPNTLIRLDANKSWSYNETQFLLSELKNYQHQIDSIEEPLLKYDRDLYQKLQNQTSINLALDESLSLAPLNSQFPVNRIILKPTVLGGIIHTLNLAEIAEKHDVETIITSVIETGYGLDIINHCCAALNNNQYHGIATACWLEDTLINTATINKGIMTIGANDIQ